MSTERNATTAVTMRAEVAKFISQNLENPRLGWPCLSRGADPRSAADARSATSNGMRVMIVGDLALELPVTIDARKEELLASIKNGRERLGFQWSMERLRVGGFVGYTLPVAHALGAQVSVCTTIPIPLPAQLETFLDTHCADRRYVTAKPGPCPVVIRLRCKDGEVVTVRKNDARNVPLDLPRTGERADVILTDPSGFTHRGATIRALARMLHATPKHPMVGLRADQQWDRIDLDLTRSERVWTFVRRRDARWLVRSTKTRRSLKNEEAVFRALSQRFDMAKLVVQLGSRGAVLFNGVPCPYYVHTCPVKPENATGAGETLLAVATLSSASGTDDRTSIRRAVAAATGLVAGLPLPSTLDELDAA